MFSFLKRIVGLPTDEEIAKARSVAVNNKTGDILDIPALGNVDKSVNDQITDSVTTKNKPAKKTRKPRTVKDSVVTEEKLPRGRKPTAKKVQK